VISGRSWLICGVVAEASARKRKKGNIRDDEQTVKKLEENVTDNGEEK
jgi:hypothetical protein